MQRNATKSAAPKAVNRSNHTARFTAVTDSRKRKIRGLWQRNGKFYAQIRMTDESGGSKPKRIPLVATDLDGAKSELEKVRTDNRAGSLPTTGIRPTFSTAADSYLLSETHKAKKTRTQTDEKNILEYWRKHLGGVRLDKITGPMIFKYREARMKAGVTARTANKETVTFYAVMKLAKNLEEISSFPRILELPEKKPKKPPLLSVAEVHSLLDACTPKVTANAALLRFYLRFLACTGAREVEALAIRWSDVNFDRRQVTVGADGESKNGLGRPVDFTVELETLLTEMKDARPPDSSFLFPSPQRGPKDIPAKKLRESFWLVRTAASLEWVGFHDLRHFFASSCVMAGIDFMTISEWLGHSDGGILVGKTYGHLNDEHKKRMAAGLSLLS